MLVDYHQLSAEKDALRHLLPDIYQETSEHEKILNFASHHTADGLLAFDNGQPVAFLLLQRAGDSADIIDIGTARQFLRRGIATCLLQHYLGHMPALALQKLYLEVAIDNVPARRLYKNAGFIEIGRRIGYYQRRNENGSISKIDALQMQYG